MYMGVSHWVLPSRTPHVDFDLGPRWEPWSDLCTPSTVQFVKLFRTSLADFVWMADELRGNLAHAPIGPNQPSSVEAQVGVAEIGAVTVVGCANPHLECRGSTCMINTRSSKSNLSGPLAPSSRPKRPKQTKQFKDLLKLPPLPPLPEPLPPTPGNCPIPTPEVRLPGIPHINQTPTLTWKTIPPLLHSALDI
ncbi:uncharacterized protein VP01_951g6 [Puccinia sorghi]|uniref:Uncharacterized protein n=1 Tax=Puccinia sorghi TaxID=27349 RepID=A0A0L6U6D6_9BASI|nr:uncharacterized protein VP01_951g6 [Puccinia sorghi]